MPSYSMRAGVTRTSPSGQRMRKPADERAAVGAALQRVDGVLGVGHHPQHVLGLVEDAGDVAGRAVGVADIAEGDLAALLQAVERGCVGKVVAFAMGDRNAQGLAR